MLTSFLRFEVSAALTLAMSVRMTASASSTAFWVPDELFSKDMARSYATLAFVKEAYAMSTSACCISGLTANRGAPVSTLSPSRTLGHSRRPASSGPTKIRSASTHP